MYKIKQKPEDFIVKEITNVKMNKNGEYTYFLLKKKDYNTETAIQKIADYTHKPRKLFGFAGSKDKIAVTEQLCSFKGKLKDFNLKDLEVKVKGYGDTPISLGDLKGNKFKIIVKDHFGTTQKKDFIINYFDDQRFSKNNHHIGKAIIKKDFKKASELIKGSGVKRNVKENDYIGFLRETPKKILQLYIHSYQSYLWNLAVDEYIRENHKHTEIKYSLGNLAIPKKEINNKKIPILGFGTEFQNPKIEEIYDKLMTKENINDRDFIIRAMPDLSSEGGERDLMIEPEEISIIKQEKNYECKFKLQKSSYATMVIKQLFS